MNTEDYAYNWGKNCSSDIKINIYNKRDQCFASVTIGNEHYESDPYQAKDLALCEVKGFLEGAKAKIEGVLQSIKRQINENKNCKKDM